MQFDKPQIKKVDVTKIKCNWSNENIDKCIPTNEACC